MQKKREPKKTSQKTSGNLEDKILQSLIDLQKVHLDVAEKFDKLSQQITNLLALFEMTARSFASQPQMQGVEKDKEFLEKIDKLLDQNKLLAKGLTLMEERMRERIYGSQQRPPQRFQPPEAKQNLY